MNRSTAAALVAIQTLLAASATLAQPSDTEPDPYLWLEDVLGEKAIAWVKEQNERSTKILEAVPEYQPIHDRTLEILDSKDRIPMPGFTGDWIFNFWQDPEHPRGILRRASLADYRKSETAWETVIDIDAMSKADDVPWVYKGKNCLAPKYERCIVSLSKGGSDAIEQREFDLTTRKFVEGGFRLPEAKSNVAWRDADTLWVGTNWGEGSLTKSGYARIVKEWKRGTPLAAAKAIFETTADDALAAPLTLDTKEGSYHMVFRMKTFFEGDKYLFSDAAANGAEPHKLVKLELPFDADFKAIFREHVLIALRSDWSVGGTTHPRGALVALPLAPLLAGKREPKAIFTPSERVALDSVATTRDRLLYTTLDNVKSRLYRADLAGGSWTSAEIALPGLGAASIVAAADDTDRFFVLYEDFLTPDSLHLSDGASGGGLEKVKALPEYFDASGLEASQHEATSKDGTKIPYFLVAKKGIARDGSAPTLLHAYGGFEVSQTPYYSGTMGSAWLERGGVWVEANIRGGGEFGPAWHEAAVRENHHRNFEDLAAVAEDLIAKRITSPKQLGIMGGSQGGLLVGGAFVLRPELYGAVVCQVPLLDMKRYSHLLAGASWKSEYGDPDLASDWEFMKRWSPYQLVRKGEKYPEVFFWTTTRDDRVHPAHARKMVAKMLDQGHPVLYYEVIEGGHGSGSVNSQKARTTALEYAYLWKKLK